MLRAINMLFGIGLLVASAWATSVSMSLQRDGVRTQGTIVDHNTRAQWRSDEGLTFMREPIVEFQPDDSARAPPLRLKMHGWLMKFSVGDTVQVVYLKSSPEHARIDRFLSLWGLSIVLAIAGIASILGKTVSRSYSGVIGGLSHRFRD